MAGGQRHRPGHSSTSSPRSATTGPTSCPRKRRRGIPTSADRCRGSCRTPPAGTILKFGAGSTTSKVINAMSAPGGDYQLRVNGGVPAQVILLSTPISGDARIKTMSLFVQDGWTIRNKLTLISAPATIVSGRRVRKIPPVAALGRHVARRNVSRARRASDRRRGSAMDLEQRRAASGRVVYGRIGDWACARPRDRRQPHVSGDACDRRPRRRRRIVAADHLGVQDRRRSVGQTNSTSPANISKRITEDFAVSFSPTWTHLYAPGGPMMSGASGFQNIETTFKYRLLQERRT